MTCFKARQIASDVAHATKIMARAHSRNAAGVRNMARKVFMIDSVKASNHHTTLGVNVKQGGSQ